MRKLLFATIAVLFSYIAVGQTYDNIYVGVWDNNFTGVPSQMVFVKVYSGTTIVHQSQGYSDSTNFGGYTDSIPNTLVFDSIVSYTFDCNGTKLRGVASPMPSNTWGIYSDTIWQSCAMNPFAGEAGLLYSQSSIQPNTIDFTDNSIGAGFPGTKSTLFCDFGDNDSSVVSANFSHTYSAPGKYYVQYSFSEYDTLGNGYHTQEWFRDTIEVLPFSPTGFCQASYWVDTLNSGSGTAIIYNNSTPSSKNASYTNTYHWDFGDGDTSNLPYPIHTYTNAGLYQVCLTIVSDSAGTTCTSTFCDSLGVDSTGALIYKNSGFMLQVLDPTVGMDELTTKPSFEVFPNPFDDVVFVKIAEQMNGVVQFTITDSKGTLVIDGELDANAYEQRIILKHLKEGIYMLELMTEDGILEHHKLIKK